MIAINMLNFRILFCFLASANHYTVDTEDAASLREGSLDIFYFLR